MKKTLVLLVVLSLLPAYAHAKSRSATVLAPHVVSAHAGDVEISQREQESGFVRQVGRPFDISASLMARDPHTVSLRLKIINASSKPLVFSPDEVVVILPNGHSYRPFTQTDVMQEAYQAEADPKAKPSPPERPKVSEISYTQGCSVEADTAACPTTADLSTEQWRAKRSALRAMTRTAIQEHKLKHYTRAVREQYLVSRQLNPGETVSGYVDLYVEDVGNGPLVVLVPAGDTKWVAPSPGKLAVPVKSYNFPFGPDILSIPD